ncbi:ComEA family DNA-binding protein [Flavisolibacter ginsenosidimutans]|uniref:Helix-hairpin-helix domain-containing protein n=1 Tax=Flavisolibacter ginsenosidimutans TaxID=661481 RepID=A0A5B8ULE4_9BACT|nr:helix-hairpin-helix domain-containing protein [Flavisolibacter ginsenosidimutans]QEC56870.1 helix-hairpin-helix domain-containing protein [Flavisolibacter ginsenosidimutans]
MKKLLFAYCCFLGLIAGAQDLPASTQQQLENLGDEELKDDALLQSLAFYKKHPLNLNEATAEDLQALRLLTALQTDAFLRYRAAFGKLIDIYELQAVPGFDVASIHKILPYVFTGPVLNAKENFLSRLKGGDQYLLFRLARTLEASKGYNASLPTHYLGDRNRLLTAYRYQYKTLLYYGAVADKDAGEQFFRGAQKLGFDFYSVHFFARNLGTVKSLALGDYVVNLGQGLTQWGSLAFGKSIDVLNTKRQSPVLLPYRSSGEFLFNRGAGITLGKKAWEATVFVSSKKFSGNIVSDSVERFTSFGTSGYYRTPSEIADRYKLTDFSVGGNLSFQNPGFKIGLNAVAHRFSLPLQKSAEPYNYFSFSGQQTFNASLDYGFTFRNAHFFGETAVDRLFNAATIHGVLISAAPNVDLSFLYRNLSFRYQSLFGNAFTDNSLPANEHGIYTGITIRPALGWQVAAYTDFYQFPFLKYRVSAPSSGWDYLLQLSYTPDKRTEIYLRCRTENKPLNDAGTTQVVSYPVDKIKQNLRLQFARQVRNDLLVKGRTEVIWFDGQSGQRQEGFLSFIEVAGSLSLKLKGNARLQYFETGGYDSRIYAYESDVPYSFSIPAFYDKGFRYYLNLSFAFTKNLTGWMRLAQTVYPGKATTGSGLDQISGNRKTEIKLEAQYGF